MIGAGVRAGPVEHVAGTASEVTKHRVEQLLEVGALGRRPCPFGPTSRGRRLDRDETLLERLEAGRHLLAELVHRRVQTGRVEQVRELRGVAVEVRLEHPPDAADRAVALLLVEQFVHHAAQGAAVAEESLEGPRKPAVAVREVRAQGLLEGSRGAFVDLLRLADQALELGLDDVDVDRDARVLEGDETDAQCALDQRRLVVARALGQERGQAMVGDDQAFDDDAVTIEADTGRQRRGLATGDRRRERVDGCGIHGPYGGVAM